MQVFGLCKSLIYAGVWFMQVFDLCKCLIYASVWFMQIFERPSYNWPISIFVANILRDKNLLLLQAPYLYPEDQVV